jgi:aminomethyltransferase
VTLSRTPLEDEHRALGAKLGEFAGWRMPIEYRGVLAEHRAVRESIGVFDLTHLGKIEVAGEGAVERLQSVLSNDVAKIDEAGAQYNLCLNEEGGIVDDLIAYRVGTDRFLVVPNAANVDRVLAAVGADSEGVEVRKLDRATLAVQGPNSAELVSSIVSEVSALDYMTCFTADREGTQLLVARSGYTGEHGYELFVSYPDAPPLWRELLSSGASFGIEPCGLGARDTLRLEMGYPLHGNDISPEGDPVEAMLSWAVALGKGDFRGRDAVLRAKERGPARRLRGLRMIGRLIPRAHYKVFRADEEVGETTSGTFSPTLRLGIALAYLSAEIEPGERVEVDVRGRRAEAEVVKPPFVDRSPK